MANRTRLVSLILDSPSTVLVATSCADRHNLIKNLLDTIAVELGASAYIFDSFSDTFFDFYDNPSVKLYKIGFEYIDSYISDIFDIAENRLKLAAKRKEKVYSGPRLYFFFDNYTLFTTAEYKGSFEKLLHIILSARQSNLYVVAFDKPWVATLSTPDYFSSVVLLNSGWLQKFEAWFPARYRKLLAPGKALFCGEEKGIYDI